MKIIKKDSVFFFLFTWNLWPNLLNTTYNRRNCVCIMRVFAGSVGPKYVSYAPRGDRPLTHQTFTFFFRSQLALRSLFILYIYIYLNGACSRVMYSNTSHRINTTLAPPLNAYFAHIPIYIYIWHWFWIHLLNKRKINTRQSTHTHTHTTPLTLTSTPLFILLLLLLVCYILFA